MKQLLVLTTLISSLIMTSVTHAEWTEIDEFRYVDYERVRQRNNGIYLVWYLTNATDHGSITFLVELDCKAIAQKLLTAKVYEKKFASGNVISKTGPNKNWQYAEPNSPLERYWTKVCRKID